MVRTAAINYFSVSGKFNIAGAAIIQLDIDENIRKLGALKVQFDASDFLPIGSENPWLSTPPKQLGKWQVSEFESRYRLKYSARCLRIQSWRISVEFTSDVTDDKHEQGDADTGIH